MIGLVIRLLCLSMLYCILTYYNLNIAIIVCVEMVIFLISYIHIFGIDVMDCIGDMIGSIMDIFSD